MAKKFKGQGAVNTGQPSKGQGSVTTHAVSLLKKNLPKNAKRGAAKGNFRKVQGGFKKRRFTIQQRRTFRSRQNAGNLGGPR